MFFLKYLGRWLFLFYSLLCFSVLQAQLETSKWYFGNRGALDFTTTPPSPIPGSAMNAWEGVASISDEDGNLLFYTNGITVWDQNNNPMPNGNGLNGNPSSAQSGIIVPKPGSDHLFYVFCVPSGGGSVFTPARLFYSVVDMTLNNGFGDVVAGSKNINISPNNRVQEKITAVLHCNGEDIWVLAHEYGSNVFLKYLIDADNPPSLFGTQAIGESWAANTNGSIGILKASANGKMIGETANSNNLAQVLDFDNQTGELSNPRTITNVPWSYGVEFSPDNNLIYISTWYDLNPRRIFYQYDLNAPNLNASRVEINTVANLGAIQLGLDGKIYIARNTNDGGGANNGRKYLGVISNPNNYDGTPAGCGWIEEGVDIGGVESNPSAGQLSRYGLPNFIQSYFVEDADFSYADTCLSSETSFSANIPYEFIDLTWDFAGLGSATDEQTTFTFPSTGTFEVQLIINGVCRQDTVVKTIEIIEGQVISINGPSEVCINATSEYQVNGISDLTWSSTGGTIISGQNTASLEIAWGSSGTFVVSAESNDAAGCSTVINPLTVTVNEEQITNFDLPDDYCQFDLVQNLPNSSEEEIAGTWNSEVNTDELGDFVLIFSPNEGLCATTFEYAFSIIDCEEEEPCEDPIIDFTANPMTGTAPLTVDFTNNSTGATVYNWNFGNGLTTTESTTAPTSTIYTEPGVYVVELVGIVDDCISSSTIEIIVLEEESCEDPIIDFTANPMTGTAPLTVDFTNNSTGATVYNWNFGNGLTTTESTTVPTSTIYTEPGVYLVELVGIVDDCISSNTIQIIVLEEAPVSFIMPNVFTPNGDGVNDVFTLQPKNIVSLEITIVNRWGNLVFESNDVDAVWDGRDIRSGEPCIEGVYFYSFTLVGINGETHSNHGFVHLVRD